MTTAHPTATMQQVPVLDTGTFLDPAQAGSKWAQVGTGVVGVVLALVLVIGQVSLATSRGIETHLKRNVSKLREGNKTMQSVIERGKPSVAINTSVAHQQVVLARSQATMHRLNARMVGIVGTTNSMTGTVGQMKVSSGNLAGGVGSMDTSTQQLATLLGGLPARAESTGTALGQINQDSADINTELGAIAGKLSGYGLPAARGVKGAS